MINYSAVQFEVGESVEQKQRETENGKVFLSQVRCEKREPMRVAAVVS